MKTNQRPTNKRRFNKVATLSCLSPIFLSSVKAMDAEALPLFTEYGVCSTLSNFAKSQEVGYEYLKDKTSVL